MRNSRKLSSPRVGGKRPRVRINNPYENADTNWLKGEIHAHVCRAKDLDTSYGDGALPKTVYQDADKAGLDFVCMSVDVTDANDGPDHFGDVLNGRRLGVVGIPGREIQNNYFYSEDCSHDYFTEAGADYLHVLTIGEDGLSICLHPRWYEIVNSKPGGSWSDIKSALLHPDPGKPLRKLRVSGIEIYNGLAMKKLQQDGRACEYSDFDERCWDEMLMARRLYWGFCGNDSFFRSADDFKHFRPLGVTYAAAREGASGDEVLESLKRGCFYASTGVRLAATPIEVAVDGTGVSVVAHATTPVDWKARIFRRIGGGWWVLTSQHVSNSESAEFETGPEWRYIRVQCESIQSSLHRAWLQPITNGAFYR
jgi:hypothetical protein